MERQVIDGGEAQGFRPFEWEKPWGAGDYARFGSVRPVNRSKSGRNKETKACENGRITSECKLKGAGMKECSN